MPEESHNATARQVVYTVTATTSTILLRKLKLVKYNCMAVMAYTLSR